MIKIVPTGGRVKAAAHGLDFLWSTEDPIELDNILKDMRQHPSRELLTAFFPGDSRRIGQMLDGIGFFRPVLKTDQGMGGNFLPFLIRPDMDCVPGEFSLSREECRVIPEMWRERDEEELMQLVFHARRFEMGRLAQLLEDVDVRRADKGRLPYFFIRSAESNLVPVVGGGMFAEVEARVRASVSEIAAIAHETENGTGEKSKPENLIYCQADAYLLGNKIVIERIQVPDVGFFLGGWQLGLRYSKVYPYVSAGMTSEIAFQLLMRVAEQIVGRMGQNIFILTRDEVIEGKEDVLELMEMESLAAAFGQSGADSVRLPLSRVGEIPWGSNVLLLNLNYEAEGIGKLFRRHGSGELTCFPNPFFQQAAQSWTGLRQIAIPSKHRDQFVELIGSHPSREVGKRDVMRRIEELTAKQGVFPDILHVSVGGEVVPVFRRSLHSWNQLARRIRRYDQRMPISIAEIPATPESLMLKSSTGSRLHVFRFMCVVE